MDFAVLGPLQVLDANGTRIGLGSAPQRRLAALLVLRAGTVVPADSLAHHLGLSPGALRTSISRLRRLLGADALVTEPPGYGVRATDVDARRFEQLVDGARSTPDPARVRRALADALSLWRGPAYEEFAHEGWAMAESRRLGERRAGAIEDLARRLLDAGAWSEAIARVEPLMAEQPFRDEPRALLLRALAESGRRTDALRAFQAYRSFLLDEVGTEPSAAIVALERAIAVGLPLPRSLGGPIPDRAELAGPRTRLVGTPTSARSPGAQRGPRAPDLPTPISTFVGRDVEVPEVTTLVGRHRLVTLTGAGGCGKTRLALAVARGLVDGHTGGTWWVELASEVDPTQVAARVALAAGLHPVPGRDPVEQLVGRLADAGPVLVVVDNAEHVLDAVATVLDAVLHRCGQVRALVTSREALGLAGEVVWRVPSLARPPSGLGAMTLDELATFDAPRLFLERAGDAHPRWVPVDGDVPAIRAICARLDGMPLAVELAAARARALPVDRLAHDLDDAFAVLDQRTGTTLARHATLAASIAWSVDQLTPADATALARLTVFAAPFTLEAAAAVIGPGDGGAGGGGARDGGDGGGEGGELQRRTSALLRRLVAKSLVQHDEGPVRRERHRLLETIRQFCAARWRGSDELVEARAGHARYWARWCTEVGEGRFGLDRGPVQQAMPDVVTALAWARDRSPVHALQMCAGLASLRSSLGHDRDFADTWAWLMAFDRHGELAGDWAVAVAASMAAATGAGLDVASVSADVERHLGPGHRRARGWLHRGRAMIPAYRGDLDPILAYAAAIAEGGDDVETSVYVGFTAYMLSVAGRVDEAQRWLDVLAAVARRRGVDFTVDTVGNGYAAALHVALYRGRLAEAASFGSAATPRDPSFSVTAASALAQTALLHGAAPLMGRAVAWSSQEPFAVLGNLVTSVTLARALADGEVDLAADAATRFWAEAAVSPLSRVNRVALLTRALLGCGRVDEARSLASGAASIVATMGEVPILHPVLHHSWAQIALVEGSLDEAASEARAMLDAAVAGGFPLLVVDALEVLALVAARAGAEAFGRRVAASAQAERARLGYRFVMLPPGVGLGDLLAERLPDTLVMSLDVAIRQVRRTTRGASRLAVAPMSGPPV